MALGAKEDARDARSDNSNANHNIKMRLINAELEESQTSLSHYSVRFYASSHPILRTAPRRPLVLFCFAEKETEAQRSKQPARGHKAWSLIQN